jgi:hypothetical protein
MMSDAETKQIEGVCEEISEKNGWTAFAINVGSQYPIRISTKLPALIEQGRAAGQQRAVWTFKETQGGENPNKPGTFYTNRYFESVEVGGTAEPSSPTPHPTAQAAVTATHSPLPPGDKDRAITRMAVLKAAAEVCANPANVSPDGDVAAEVIAMAARFETWVVRDLDDVPFG